MPSQVVRTRGKDVAFDLVAADDDDCNELSIRHTGLYDDMQLSEHTFDNPKQVRNVHRPAHLPAHSMADMFPALDDLPLRLLAQLVYLNEKASM